MTRFAAVYESKDIIELIFCGDNGFEVLGHLMTDMEDRIDMLKDEGTEFTRENIFTPLNCDTGYCWSIKTKYGLETWYILDKTIKEKDI